MSKKKLDTHASRLKKFLIPVLRRATYRWPDRSQAMKNARKERGVYICATCKGEFGNKDIALDHVEPVIPSDGAFTDWNTYIVRLFCETLGFQVLCTNCHDSKTLVEDKMRLLVRQDEREKIKSEKKIAKSKKKV